jgi:hypothetical protein
LSSGLRHLNGYAYDEFSKAGESASQGEASVRILLEEEDLLEDLRDGRRADMAKVINGGEREDNLHRWRRR